MSIRETKDGTSITIFVKPNSTAFKIAFDGEEIVVYSTEAPEKGKVNKEILKETSRLFNVPVEIISGHKTRRKTLLVRTASRAQVELVLKR